MALTLWLLGLAGVHPSAEDMARDERQFQERGHRVTFEFAGERLGVARMGLGYQFMFFNVGMEPFAFYELRTDGQPAWALNFRFVY